MASGHKQQAASEGGSGDDAHAGADSVDAETDETVANRGQAMSKPVAMQDPMAVGAALMPTR